MYASHVQTRCLYTAISWPNLICNLSFQVTLPRRIPVSYSVIVNCIPREWNVDTIYPLLAERYTSTDRVTRIFHDNQPTTKLNYIQFFLQTISSHVNSNTLSLTSSEQSKLEQTDQSSVIVKALKDEITKSHDILIDKILHIEQKTNLIAIQQHLSSLQMIETKIVPYLLSMLELLVNVYDKLHEKKIIQATGQQNTKLSLLHDLSTTHNLLSAISYDTSTTSTSSLLTHTEAQLNLSSLTTPPCNQSNFDSLSQLSLKSNHNKNLLLQKPYFL
ncbi:unnamed protein product [Rotaria sp. Silwood1]|nr:unnamed protein product [Rotaria sp. Silwood1]